MALGLRLHFLLPLAKSALLCHVGETVKSLSQASFTPRDMQVSSEPTERYIHRSTPKYSYPVGKAKGSGYGSQIKTYFSI